MSVGVPVCGRAVRWSEEHEVCCGRRSGRNRRVRGDKREGARDGDWNTAEIRWRDNYAAEPGSVVACLPDRIAQAGLNAGDRVLVDGWNLDRLAPAGNRHEPAVPVDGL